jgi:putative DNA primase/helicase
VARDMVAVADRALPVLEGVVTSPVFGRSGDLIFRPGYHEEERLWFHPLVGITGLDIPSDPSPRDIDWARSLLLDDLLVDFPFVDDASRAHAVAALLLPSVRRMIAGCTPIHLLAAPAEGTGKGLLCNLISITATGAECSGRTLAADEDEARKMITAELATGRPVILLDNNRPNRTLRCAALASVVTFETWTDRLLGQSDMVTLPNRALWLLTGNNPRLSMEIARRCVRIRLDAGMDRAWQRRHFRHDHIIAWAKQRRCDLLRATLVLGQAWIVAGRPRHPALLGSFEDWSALMGGMLAVAGIPGFLGNLEELYQEADVEGEMWREFVGAWWEAHGEQPKRPAELLDLCLRHELMLPVLGDGSPRSQQTRLGGALRGARDRVFRGVRIALAPDPRGRGHLYALRPLPRSRPATEASGPGWIAPPAPVHLGHR